MYIYKLYSSVADRFVVCHEADWFVDCCKANIVWCSKHKNALTKILVRLLYLWNVSQENLSAFYLVNIIISQTIDLVQFVLTKKIHQFVFFVIMLLQGRSAGVHLVGTVLEPSMEWGWSASAHFAGTLLEPCMEWGWSAGAHLAETVLEPCMERDWNAFVHLSFVFCLL